jgi:hypothetical protein
MFGRVVAIFWLVLAVFGLAAGCSDGVVGGECRPGYSPCGHSCFDLQTSLNHCGACGTVCESDEVCVNGGCRPESTDAGSGGAGGSGGTGGSGGASGGSGGDAGADAPDAPNTGGRQSNGGTGSVYPDGGDPNIRPDGGICVGPYDDPRNCGSCGNVCPPDKPLCALNEDYECVERCEDPLTDCGGKCVNTDLDPNNCGFCGNRCESQICQGGECVGATAGHEILFCADYRQKPVPGTAFEKLLGNAAFLSPAANIRIMAYEEFAPAAVVNSVKLTLASLGTQRGRLYTLTEVFTSVDVTNNLDTTNFEVLLVFDQQLAPAGRLAETGSNWEPTVTQFVRAGGIVIVLAGPTGRGEMDDFLTAANFLPVFGQRAATNTEVYNRAPGDAIGLAVISPLLALPESCTFDTDPPGEDTTFVVTDTPPFDGDIGNPVVVHRVIAP